MVVVERRAPENTESSARIPLARPFERGEAPPRLASGALRCQTLAIVWKQALGVVAIAAGLGFGYVATSVATEGTGMALPEGADVVEGDVAEAPLRDAPFGDPFVFGEVRVSRSGSRAIEQSWSTDLQRNRPAGCLSDWFVLLPSARDHRRRTGQPAMGCQPKAKGGPLARFEQEGLYSNM